MARAVAFVQDLESRTLLAASMVEDVYVGSSDGITVGATEPVALGSKLIFAGSDSTHGQEPWVSDGTASGTRLLRDLNTSGTSWPQDFTVAGTKVYYSADTPSSGRELWVTDGTSGGTKRVADINPGKAGSNVHDLTASAGRLYFLAYSPSGWALRSTTSSGLKTIVSGWGIQDLVDVDGTLFFRVTSHPQGKTGLWKLSAGVPTLVKQGVASELPVSYGGLLAFTVGNNQVWKSDGMSAGTVKIATINPTRTNPQITKLFRVGGRLYATCTYGKTAIDLWRVTPTRASLVYTFASSTCRSPVNFTDVGGTLYFSAYASGQSRRCLWKISGTTPVCMPKAYTGSFGFNPSEMTAVAGRMYYAGTTTANGRELYSFDGAGQLVRNIGSGSASSDPMHLTAAGSKLFFSADDSHGRELWRA